MDSLNSASYAGNAVNSQVNFDKLQSFDEQFFDDVDKETSTKEGVSANLSSQAQFMFSLQVHAANLNDEDRTEFADAVQKTQNPLFDDAFIDDLKVSHYFAPNIDPESIKPSSIDIHPKSDEIPEIIVTSVGKISEFTKPYQIQGMDDGTHIINELNESLEELSVHADAQLSKQDAATMKGTFQNAIVATNNQQSDWYSMLKTHHQFDLASQAIEKLPLSEDLKTGYELFLSHLKDVTYAVSEIAIKESESFLDRLPQKYHGDIEVDIQKMKEGVEVSKKFGEYLESNNNSLKGSEDVFKGLINTTQIMDKPSSIELSGTMNWLEDDADYFQFKMIDKEFIQEIPKRLPSEAITFHQNQSTNISNQFIDAINSYIEVSNGSNI